MSSPAALPPIRKYQISGHKNITQTARYDRKRNIVPIVGGQKKERCQKNIVK